MSYKRLNLTNYKDIWDVDKVRHIEDGIIANEINLKDGEPIGALYQEIQSNFVPVRTDGSYMPAAMLNRIPQEGGEVISGAFGDYSIALNGKSQAYGAKSFASGSKTIAFGNNSHTEGNHTVAYGQHSHAEGNSTQANGIASHAEGVTTTTHHEGGHSEGVVTEAAGLGAHAEGYGTLTSSESAHAEGHGTRAFGSYSHAEGWFTHAEMNAQHAQGKYNVIDTTENAFIIGNGTAEDQGGKKYRSNAMAVSWTGNLNIAGEFTSATGADYAEYFEWTDGNPSNEDRVGYLVTLDEDKINLATENDDILGIVSGTAAVVGDVATWDWQGKYLTDEFGRVIWDNVEEFVDAPQVVSREEVNEKGEIVTITEVITTTKSAGFFPHRRLNPEYNPEEEYIPRSARKEWDMVGLVGKLHIRDDGTCLPNCYIKVGSEPGIATLSVEKTNMRMMKRISDNIILAFVK